MYIFVRKGDRMEFVKLSKRLQTVAEMVTKGSITADIGTDHGYLPIYLVQNEISPYVIAMDVNKGPLHKAHNNIEQNNLADKIETRLSDGLAGLKKDEAKTITICGMGGKLMARIIEDGIDRISVDNELILSPQSEIFQFREYLIKRGFAIIKEEMLIDEGKFYVIMKCEMNGNIKNTSNVLQTEPELFLKYGRYLLEHKNTTLKQYLIRERKKYLKVRENVVNCDSENIESRINEIDHELKCIEEGLNYYEMQ